MLLCIIIVSERYVCDLKSTAVSLEGLNIVRCMNFYVKRFNRFVEVKKKKKREEFCGLMACM